MATSLRRCSTSSSTRLQVISKTFADLMGPRVVKAAGLAPYWGADAT
jgi:hypothetical protein